MNNLDTDTLNTVFNRLLNDGEEDAALTVASMLSDAIEEPQNPREWLRENYSQEDDSKIKTIKRLREKFDLPLKDAKKRVDIFENETMEESREWVLVEHPVEQGEPGMDVIVNGEEDTITQLDPGDRYLRIATENCGWIAPEDQEWHFPKSAVR
jgi:hypothetical protein